MNSKRVFFITVLLTAALFCISLFGINIGNFQIKGADQMRYGIDIRGGVEATYEPKDLGRAPSENELEAIRTIIETRMDAKNITDRDVTVDKINGKVIVRFPWKSDEANFNPQKAVSELGETARLTFRDPDGNVALEGTDVTKCSAQLSPTDATPVVELNLSANGADKFAQATGRLIGQNIDIYMDETLVSTAIVGTQITGGNAEITHLESLQAASLLANRINSGSLPYSLVVKNCNIISPTLGSNALAVMVMAGQVAFGLVCLFMLLYYRLPGLVACIALILQVTGQLLALSVPQFTLTLPGIAGLILSIGMGVDANIIVSERIKEELNGGKTLLGAIETGFERAFSAVFDGNITVVIVAIILIIFGSGSMLSFGYTLLCGVIMNFIAGVTASRLMIRSLCNFEAIRLPQYFGARRAVR
ncbi:MAG TPA: protein translocase subunit SecD [Syntrophomonadaceae bacterium]|nr:protein translocase subunit SecD [Syntrophomonadaceae bacterium]